jgi:HlyD family secretion protein
MNGKRETMKRFLAVLAALLAVAFFAGTLYFLWAKSREAPVVYQTESLQRADVIKKAVSTGSVVPRREVAIKPRVSGIVEELHVEPGTRVRAGDLIARIRLVPDMVRLSEAQSRVEKARIALVSAEADYARNQPLVREGLVSASSFQPFETARDQAKAELQTATNNVDLIEKGISRTSGEASNTLVRSTIPGTVLEVPVKVGNSVIETNTFNEGTTLATVADMGDMIFLGRVDESEVGKLRAGMTLLLTIGAIDGQRPEAILEHIAPKGVEKDGAIQFEIKAAVEPMKDVVVRANYSSNADIVLDRRDRVLTLNESLLTFDGDRKYVEVEVAPQRFERREVGTGLSDGIRIEVLSGLTERDKVKGRAAEARAGS